MVISGTQRLPVRAWFFALHPSTLLISRCLALGHLSAVGGRAGGGDSICSRLGGLTPDFVYGDDRRGGPVVGFWRVAISLTLRIFHLGGAIPRH